MTLTGHIEQVREAWGCGNLSHGTVVKSCYFLFYLQVTGLVVSPRHPYMFSCGLDKQVKCWDLEQNKASLKCGRCEPQNPDRPQTTIFMCLTTPHSTLGHPELPRPPLWRLLNRASPYAGPFNDRREGQCVPRVGHAHQGAGALPVGA
jgi:hypothetical protein